MLAFGVVCLAFDVDDDPEHVSCGGGTVRGGRATCLVTQETRQRPELSA